SGIVEAFIIAKQFIGNESCALILGDNIFYGAGLIRQLKESVVRADNGTATIFGYYVKDPSRYGVIEFDKDSNAISIEEKPKEPKSNYCATGLYFYPKDVTELSALITPSKRGEIEITDLNNLYLTKKRLFVVTLGRGYSWIDAGTHESLVDASNYVKILEEHQGIKISCPEEIAFINDWISKEMLIIA
ncbi:MAG: sugar phosphate nucleotidyltransferase, partial [Flavobacterium sp.]